MISPVIIALAASTSWYWLGTVLVGGSTTSPNPSSYTMTLTGDRLALKADCNRGSGSFELHDDRMVVKPIALTRRACVGVSLGDYFAKQLQTAVRMREEHEVLRLELASEMGSMFFAKDPGARLLAWRCRDGTRFNAVLVGRILQLWIDGKSYELTHVPSASGARYSDGSIVTLDTKGVLASLQVGPDLVARECQMPASMPP